MNSGAKWSTAWPPRSPARCFLPSLLAHGGYLVRTLGMHRVYNSAFMNMMRDEENAKYRSVIKNTLEFDPDIMKRYVNFMSIPMNARP